MGWSSCAPARQRRGGADLGDGERGQFVAMVDERPVELLQAVDPQVDVGGPTRVSNARAGRCDGRLARRRRCPPGRGPVTSPVAGLTRGKRTVAGSTSFPSISIRRSAGDVCDPRRQPCSAARHLRSLTSGTSTLLTVMEISFSSPANHTFADENTRKARPPSQGLVGSPARGLTLTANRTCQLYLARSSDSRVRFS